MLLLGCALRCQPTSVYAKKYAIFSGCALRATKRLLCWQDRFFISTFYICCEIRGLFPR